MTYEKWKPVTGYEGLYMISNMGRLKSFKQNPNGRILKLTNKKGDYLRVVLQGKNHRRKSISVHRLVAIHFVENPENYPEVNHIDRNKQNNAASNLEWCTQSYNIQYEVEKSPGFLRGINYYNQCVKPVSVLQIDKNTGIVLAKYMSAKEAEKKTGVCSRNILQVANGTPYGPNGLKRKTAGGYVWKFEREVIDK